MVRRKASDRQRGREELGRASASDSMVIMVAGGSNGAMVTMVTTDNWGQMIDW